MGAATGTGTGAACGGAHGGGAEAAALSSGADAVGEAGGVRPSAGVAAAPGDGIGGYGGRPSPFVHGGYSSGSAATVVTTRDTAAPATGRALKGGGAAVLSEALGEAWAAG